MEPDITARHLEAADQLLMEGGTSKSLDFPGGCKMTIGYGCVSFRKEIDQTAARAKTRLKMRSGRRRKRNSLRERLSLTGKRYVRDMELHRKFS